MALKKTDTDGTIVVSGANSAYIVVTLGTDYELTSEAFTADDNKKPTFNTDIDDTRVKVEGDMNEIDAKIAGKSYDDAYSILKNAHIADYSELFGRVSVDLGCNEADFNIPTDELLESYKSGYKSTYLEVLLFQYGRYQLIAASRSGALPANLQGVWNPYNTAAWGSAYWHNINVQMNYWPAFSTNLAETFEPYVEYNKAYMTKAEQLADRSVKNDYSEFYGKDGGNGWVVGTSTFPFRLSTDANIGNLGLTTQMYWEYYTYTRDPEVLEMVYDLLVDAARYITKRVKPDEDGNYLVQNCDSPESYVGGVWYYTNGTTYAQSLAYLNNYHVLEMAKELGIDLTDSELLSQEDYLVLNTIMEQIDKYDPINIGLSGQVKEFRQEDYYGSMNDDPNHRHISQLIGLYPGNIINSATPAWIDASLVTLEGRGQNTSGAWVYAHKTALYARAKEGDEARERIDELLVRDTFPNLFTRLWDIYQFEAGCGVTAGVAEMLLQSNAGYIEPLAALPTNWSSGSYTGLCAEGNFEVSTAWENRTAKTVNILSKSGNTVSVAYPSISNVNVVRASDGETIAYTVDTADRISFNTEKGETYIISGFKAQEMIDTPASFVLERDGEFGEFTFNWETVANAESYNVYMAIENSATYTLIGNTESNSFSFKPNKENENARTTFAVTAVSASGTESKRTLCYSNLVDTSANIIETKAFTLESGEVQIVINANSNSEKFRLYSKSESDANYTLVSESFTPIFKVEDYNSTLKYAVSAISYYDGAESELSLVADFVSSSTKYNKENIFEGKSFVQNGTNTNAAELSSTYGYAKLTDGIKASTSKNVGRYSSKAANSTTTRVADAVIDLEAEYFLDEITFYVYGKNFLPQIGTNFKIEVYSDNQWVTVISDLKNVYADDYVEGETSISDYLVPIGNGEDQYHLVFDLGGIRGSKVKFYSETIYKEGDSAYNYITFWEVECSGALIEGAYESVSNILLEKEFVQEKTAPNSLNIAPYSGYEYSKLTDGIINRSNQKEGRYSSQKAGAAYATVDLSSAYLLDKIKFYYHQKNINNAGTNYNVEVYYNGAWETVVNNVPVSEFSVSNNNTTDGYIFFNLGGVKAEKIRFYAEASSSNGYVTLYEIECSGYLIREIQNIPDRTPIIEAYDKLVSYNVSSEVHQAKMKEFRTQLTDFELTESEITALAEEMKAYCATLTPNISFAPKTSITLSNALIYNVYIPKTEILKSFTLDGVSYTDFNSISDKVKTLSGDEQYYHFEIELPASEAARNIELKATINLEGTNYNGKWSMSIPKYAEKLISIGNEVEIQLVKDVLAYIRAAYAFFDTKDEVAMGKIDTLLGDNYDANNVPLFDGSADVPTKGLKAATFVLNATPAIRFYISSTTDKYEFFVKGEKLSTKNGSDGNGAYIEMDVYAYAMCETVTYTINGVESGSYHINSYYTFVTTDDGYKNNQELTNLVARFAKYCESSKVYRNYVLSQNSGN